MDSYGLSIGSSVLVSVNMTINNSGGGAWAGTLRCHPPRHLLLELFSVRAIVTTHKQD